MQKSLRLSSRRLSLFFVPILATFLVHLLKVLLRDLLHLETHLLFLYGVLIFSTWYSGRVGTVLSLMMSIAFLRFDVLSTDVLLNGFDVLLFFLEGLAIGAFTNSYFNGLFNKSQQHQQLVKARNKLQLAYLNTNRILTSISDAFISLDKHYRITFINPAAAELIGKSREELLGKDFFNTFKCRDQEQLRTQLIRAGISDQPGHLTTGLTQSQYLDLHFYAHFPSISIFINDITHQRLLDMRKDEFINMASHELKTPLATLTALLEILQLRFDSLKKEEQFKYFQDMENQLQVLQGIVNNLLDVARIRGNKMVLERTLVDFDSFVAMSVSDLRVAFPESNLEIEGKTTARVYIDRHKIQQVLTNLVRNAVIHAAADKNIQIRLELLPTRKVKLAVKDHGPGIAPQFQKKIFDSYFQTGKPEPNQGLGLGLYIAKKIIQMHRGEIGLKSQLNHGSCFYFSLPVAHDNKK